MGRPAFEKFLVYFVFLLLFCTCLFSVDRNNFKTCEQSGFCKRHRAKSNVPPYNVEPSSVTINETAIKATLASSENRLKLVVALLEDKRLRIQIDEDGTPLRNRFDPIIALDGEPTHKRLLAAETSDESNSFFTDANNGFKIVLNHRPFRIDVYSLVGVGKFGAKQPDPIISVNSRQLLKLEHFRKKGENEMDGDGFWQESFKEHTDSKPFGSSSVGIDVSFINFKFIFGLPEHADSFTLRSTTDRDPYRLYNLDVFEYELDNGMALYGSVPFVVLPNPQRTVGALWLNAAETWVDIHSSTADKGVLASLVSHFKSSQEVPQVDAHFMSESGLIDLFLFLGPTSADVFRQNSMLTGVFPLPPISAIAYHQCRWNYNDETDLLNVHSSFDEHDIPVDMLWLDIEHTDGKRYFTWDPVKFSKPSEMMAELESKGRSLVTIIDPHIKVDDNYHIYREAKENGYFVKKKVDSDSDYEGHCWPGSSSWNDFLNPAVREFWANKFALDQYVGSSVRTFTWNDMNEPSVFTGPEVTMHKDALHFGGWEHRDIHNIYGMLQVLSTFEGHLRRSDHRFRPFILTRAFFVGIQRYATVWTGDNKADWSHLKISGPMLLSLSVAGIPNVGADVGGFFGNPDPQLLVRWYQAGAFQPFFRAHAHIDTRRREPWLFEKSEKDAIHKAIRLRYKFLPYWYTLFYEHTRNGSLVMRPMWAEFPEDELCYDEERQWMVGPALLVRPVTEPDVTQISTYLPGKSQAWYEWDTNKMYLSPGAVYSDTPLDKFPFFQRGGTIIPLRERARRSTRAMRNDPLTLYIAAELDREHADGTIYMDDGETFNHTVNGQYFYWGIAYRKVNDVLYTITSKNLDKHGKFDPDVWVEKIIIRGVSYYPRNIHMYYDDYNPEDLEFEHDREKRLIIIRKPGCYITREWRIDIHCS